MRPILLICLLLGALAFGWLRWRDAASRGQQKESAGSTISKRTVQLANRTFDPASPPPEMPPLSPGETAECDSNFVSSANVSGETRQTDATHATVTINHVKVDLQLNIIIWATADASPHVIEHEDGHRQISEYYYATADKIAERVAAGYMGRQVEITGADLNAESSKMLQQMASEITAEYGKELNPEPTQLLYDSITDHSRNDVVAKDAVAHALKNISMESN